MSLILIVEDHADIRRLVRLTLEFEDCQVHEAADALTGWEMVRALRPDLVLLDVMMPGAVNGLDLCTAIKGDAQLHRTRVIMLSARGTSADREAGLRAGADAYLVKPFSPMQLLELIGESETTL
jgi:DNA-binding response OmpR family regulator